MSATTSALPRCRWLCKVAGHAPIYEGAEDACSTSCRTQFQTTLGHVQQNLQAARIFWGFSCLDTIKPNLHGNDGMKEEQFVRPFCMNAQHSLSRHGITTYAHCSKELISEDGR